MTPKDVLIFESDAISIEPSVNEQGIRSNLPLGDDLATFLRRELNAMGTPRTIGEPVLEDFGSVLLLDQGRKHFAITITRIVGPNERHWRCSSDRPTDVSVSSIHVELTRKLVNRSRR